MINEKFIEEMKANIEAMCHEYGLDNVHTGVCHTWSNPDKEFAGIMIYPRELYENVLDHIETILDEDDCDTISCIVDDFTYTIRPHDLLTRTNKAIVDEVAMMLKAYEASPLGFIYKSKGVFDNQKLVFDYDKEVYIYTADNSIPVIMNEEFQNVNDVKYEHYDTWKLV